MPLALGSRADRFTDPLNFRRERHVDDTMEGLVLFAAAPGSRQDAEDLVQETFTRVLVRPVSCATSRASPPI
jgi:DNA-directed RNA polymerase specialized sigma24 family protein